MKKLTILLVLACSMAQADVIVWHGMSNSRDLADTFIMAGAGGHTVINCAQSGYAINAIHVDMDTYWQNCDQIVAQAGYQNSDIDIVVHKNVTGNPPCPGTWCGVAPWSGDEATEQKRLTDWYIEHMVTSEARYTNMQVGYLIPRSSGAWSPISPENFADDTPQAIRDAIENFDLWHEGPNINPVERGEGGTIQYVQSDFRDGTHMTTQGLLKANAVIEAFFAEHHPVPTEPPAEGASDAYVEPHQQDGWFDITWQGKGSVLHCEAEDTGTMTDLAVTGSIVRVRFGTGSGARLPFSANTRDWHRCWIDDDTTRSNRFGCINNNACGWRED